MDEIFEDTSCWVCFEDKEEGHIWVYARCPKCGKYIKHGKVLTNLDGDIFTEQWICKTHGEVEPFCTRGE